MKHILIVDDNKTNLIMARQELKEEYEVTPVISGEQALQFLEKRIPDLILLDINMPVMDGKETLTRIKANPVWSNIPVIFLTSDESSETEAECLRLGAEDYIRKPFVAKVMKSRIERVINLHTATNDFIDLSRRDPLTGLYNRKYTEECIGKILKDGTPGMLFMIDLDNFKLINDKMGHTEGDIFRLNIRTDSRITAFCQFIDYVMSELSADTGYQNFHCFSFLIRSSPL